MFSFHSQRQRKKNMSSLASTLIFTLLSLLSSVTRAQDRAPHGIAYENPMALSPSAFDFFHPSTERPPPHQDPCAASKCSPLPLAATVASTLAHESKSVTESRSRPVGAGAIAGIVFGFVFAAFLAVGVYYAVVTRRRSSSRSRGDSVQPHDAA